MFLTFYLFICIFFFFFNDTATTEIYTLSLHDALPISQNRTVACRRLGPRRTAGGSSLRADEGVQSSRAQALLKATQGSRGVTERACQIVLIDVSGFVERNQGIGFGRAILSGVVGVDDTMDENDALVGFDLKGNGVIDKHHLGNGREIGEEITCMRIRVHGRIGCPSFPEKKSGQVLVRTLKGQKPKPDAAGTPVPHDNFPLAVAGDASGTDGRLKKRTGFGSHPGRQKLKPDAAEIGRAS